MQVQAITTGTVRITHNWQQGEGPQALRLLRTMLDRRMTEPLPIWCYVIEHPEGIILVDTGIPANANDPVWLPPYMRLLQRAAPFQINGREEEIDAQLRRRNIDPADVRWVVLTHLHQDHEGGLHHFPNAEFVVARKEWDAAAGWGGRMLGYLNFRWPRDLDPTLVDFSEPDAIFDGRTTLTEAGDVYLVPTPGHSPGHLSLVVEEGARTLFIAGDAAYTEELLVNDVIDGVGPSAAQQHTTHAQIVALARQTPLVFLPSHEWAAADRLAARTPLRMAQTAPARTQPMPVPAASSGMV